MTCLTYGNLSSSGGEDSAYEDGSRSITFPSVEQSAQTCPICAVLWQFVSHFKFDRSSRRGGVLRVVNEGGPFAVYVDVNRTQVKGPFDIFIQPESRSISRKFLEFAADSYSLPGDTSSEESLLWLKAQLVTCRASHFCGSTSSSTLPTRVIDASYNGNNIEEDVKLLVTNRQQGKYLALSHCWGKSGSPIITTKANKLHHLQSIPFKALSKTFQDAVSLTRRLGERYIWIDSLCIIQDDPEDWEAESARMASIYQNALLTIAATSSPNGKGGCYHHISVNEQDAEFTIRLNKSRTASIYFRPRIQHLSGAFGVIMDTKSFPLLDRGWVFQERVLSPRTLHCCDREFVFECSEAFTCQCGVYSPERPLLETFKSALSLRDNRFLSQKEWKAAVQQYTILKLTESKDKLPAFSGIASQARRGEYLAGLFKDDLPMNLVWSVPVGLAKKNRIAAPRAPSWSWASIDGPINHYRNHPEENLNPLVTVLEARCKVLGINSFGQVDGGKITLRGRVTVSELAWSIDIRAYQRINWIFSSLQSLGMIENFNPDLDFWTLGAQRSMRVSCLWLAGSPVGSVVQRMVVLILRETQSRITKFERIGILIFQPKENYENASALKDVIIE